MYTFLGELVAYKEEIGGYIVYVFKKIDYKNEYEIYFIYFRRNFLGN